MAQWLRIRLPMQGTRVRALVREDPTCRGATKPTSHNCWACALEPLSHNYWARVPQLLKPVCPRACAPQQEKPQQWEACSPQRRVAPARRNWRRPVHSNEDPKQPKINKEINLFKKKKKDNKPVNPKHRDTQNILTLAILFQRSSFFVFL